MHLSNTPHLAIASPLATQNLKQNNTKQKGKHKTDGLSNHNPQRVRKNYNQENKNYIPRLKNLLSI